MQARHGTYLAVVVGFAAFAIPATHLMATVIPPIGLPPGSQYHLMFVTQGHLDQVTSQDISFYNSYVTTEASQSSSLPSATWYAYGNAPGWHGLADAFGGDDRLPVYNTAGQLVVAQMNDIYAFDPLLSPIGYDQFGTLAPYEHFQDFTVAPVWSGFGFNFELGGGPDLFCSQGDARASNSALGVPPSWFNYEYYYYADGRDGFPAHLYAASAPLTVPVPEQTTFALLGSALLLMGGRRFLRWRWGAFKQI